MFDIYRKIVFDAGDVTKLTDLELATLFHQSEEQWDDETYCKAGEELDRRYPGGEGRLRFNALWLYTMDDVNHGQEPDLSGFEEWFAAFKGEKIVQAGPEKRTCD